MDTCWWGLTLLQRSSLCILQLQPTGQCFFLLKPKFILSVRFEDMENIQSVALCGWAAKADDSFVCFGAKPDKGFLDLKSCRIRKWEGDAKGQLTGDPDESSWRWTAERRAAESWRGTTDRGSQHRTRETVAEKIGSSDSESRWVWFQ